MPVGDTLYKLVGWPAGVLHGDPCMFDRWLWLRRRLESGPVRTLDAGSGSGAFALFAATRGNEVVGVSFDRAANDRARRRAALIAVDTRTRFVDGDLRELRELARGWPPFRQAICLEVIEHLDDDEALIADLAALLEPGGRLLLTTPHERHRPFFGEHVSATEDGGHVRWGYSVERLRQLLAEAGLELVEHEVVSGGVSQQLTNAMRLFNRVFPRLGWLVTLPLRPLQALDRPLSRLVGYPPVSVAVVAVKPFEEP